MYSVQCFESSHDYNVLGGVRGVFWELFIINGSNDCDGLRDKVLNILSYFLGFLQRFRIRSLALLDFRDF